MTENSSIAAIVDNLVKSAKERGGFNFAMALLRVGGIEEKLDPFVDFQDTVPTASSLDKLPSLCDFYSKWVECKDLMQFTLSLIRISKGEHYQPFPFRDLYTDHTPVESGPTIGVIAEFTSSYARLNDDDLLADLIDRIYSENVRHTCQLSSNISDKIKWTVIDAIEFWKELITSSFRERKAIGTKPSLHKWPQYEVLETLANDEVGLYGYRVHFSNGSRSEYLRLNDRTTAVNLLLRDEVNYNVGMLNTLVREWKVNNRPLYEIGLPGRYNQLGEWKPLVYPGKSDEFSAKASLAAEDPRIRGALLYVYLTGHHVVEFVARTSVDLPLENTITFGNPDRPIKLWKCPAPDALYDHWRIYDGWTTIAAPTSEAIAEAIIQISIGLSRLAFVYDADLTWCVKYSSQHNTFGLATPDIEDIERFNEIAITVPAVIDYAIDWCNQGRKSQNPFTSFLCYFNAIESLVEAAQDGERSGIELSIARPSKSERNKERLKCIEELHDALFESDPVQFVDKAYFLCVRGVGKKREEVAKLVWGENHEAVRALFTPTDAGISLTDLRNDIAHGRLSLLDPDDVQDVRSRLAEVSKIAKGMILRLLLKKTPEETLSVWSGKHRLNFNMTDPRNTMVVSDLAILPKSDWKIRPEWCED